MNSVVHDASHSSESVLRSSQFSSETIFTGSCVLYPFSFKYVLLLGIKVSFRYSDFRSRRRPFLSHNLSLIREVLHRHKHCLSIFRNPQYQSMVHLYHLISFLRPQLQPQYNLPNHHHLFLQRHYCIF